MIVFMVCAAPEVQDGVHGLYCPRRTCLNQWRMLKLRIMWMSVVCAVDKTMFQFMMHATATVEDNEATFNMKLITAHSQLRKRAI